MRFVGETHGVVLHENVDLGVPGRVDVLDYSGTASGTHKTIKAREALTQLHPGYTGIAITSGNYGLALKHAAEALQRKVILACDPRFVGLEELRGEYSDLACLRCLTHIGLAANGRPPHGQFAQAMGYPDLSGSRLPAAYRSLMARQRRPVYEQVVNITNITDLAQNLAFAPPVYGAPVDMSAYDTVIVPAGSGELLYDLARQEQSGNTRFIGVVPQSHPMITGLGFDDDLVASVAAKLMTPTMNLRGYFGGLEQVSFLDATEDEFLAAHRFAEARGFSTEVSGAAAFASLLPSFLERHGPSLADDARVLFVNTGKGPAFRWDPSRDC